MKVLNILATTALITMITGPQAKAQGDADVDTFGTEVRTIIPRKVYWSSMMDAAILSTATLSKPGQSDRLSTVRFSYFFNIGANLNYDVNEKFGLFTGLGIKNIGFIEKYQSLDSTVKRRVYTIGLPLGIKWGNLQKRNFFIAGGGIDLAFNYKEKGFIRRGNKDKFSEWFSSRTPAAMPYVFVGGSLNPGITMKLQYYPGNFLNTDYTDNINGVSVKPYAGYDVHLILLSFGFDIHYNKKPKEHWDTVKKTL